MAFEFVIPRERGELLRSGKANQYVVEELLPVRQLSEQIQAFQSAFRTHGPLALLEHFDAPYSILSHFRSIDPELRWQTLDLLLKVVSRHSSDLPEVLQDSALPPSGRLQHLNTLKMSCYLLTQLATAFEDQQYKQELANVGPSGKARKMKPKSGSFDWESERPRVLQALTHLLQLDIRKLWTIGQVEEDFTRLVTSCCYHVLENPSIGHVKNRASSEAVTHLLGVAIKRYNHMLGATLNVIQLLQHFEHLAPVLAQSVAIWAGDYGLRPIVGEIMREVGVGEGARESAGARACAAFLAELADRVPEAMVPNISLVLDLLNGESYTLRNAVLSAMGQMVTRVLSGPGLDDGARETRDRFLDTLQLHVHDVHAFVRSRSLQVLTHVVQEKALPVKRFQTLVSLATGRLCDKSVNVCKHAIQLLAVILANNPFTWKLSVTDLQSAHEKEVVKLTEMRGKKQVAAMVLEPDQEWEAMQPEILVTIEDVLGSHGVAGADGDEEEEAEEGCDSEGERVAVGEGADLICQRVGCLLKKAKYRPAVRLVLNAWEQFPDEAPFTTETRENAECGQTHPHKAGLLKVMEACFRGQPRAGAEPPASGAEVGEQHPLGETPEPSELAKQEVLVQYLEDTLTFATRIEGAIEIVSKFLSSKNPSVVQEAIQFFVTISEFGIAQALPGMRRMLPLVWSKEAGVKEAVTDAYRRLYLNTGGHSPKPQVLVQQLTALIFDASMETIKCLEQLVSDFVQKKEIEPTVIQLLWECLTEKVPCSPDERRAAVILLGMAARGEPEIVGSNLETLYTVGLGPCVRQQQDFQLARDICLTMGKISHSQKKLLSGSTVPFRLPHDHPLFTHIADTVTEGFPSRSPHWRPFAEAAVSLIYQLAENPDRLCGGLLARCARLLAQRPAPRAEDGEKEVAVPPSQQSEEACNGQADPGDPRAVTAPVHLLTNLISLVGHVALQQMLHLEKAVGPELQRRRLSRERQDAKDKLKGKGKRASCSAMEDELGLTEASADDTEAELVRRICDVELLDEHQLLSAFVPLIVKVCTSPGKYSDADLCTASALALCKIAMVSHDFCESQLRLLFTMLDKSALPSIRANTMVALGDLSFRFPNLVEPWTPHLYARLRDSSVSVRRTALVVMTHLILKDMVKVKGQISEMAVLLVDGDERISSLARSFFNELSNKGNAVYNLLPDIISRLSDPDCGVDQQPFELIMRQMFSYITKDKQTESLVEKLCQRFRTARLERQHRDLAFCLSLLPASERGLRKLQENFECFADKLTDDVVYQHLAGIASKLHRGIKPDLKVLVEEFEQKISRYHNRGLDDDEVITAKPAPGREAARGKAQEEQTVTSRVHKRRQPSRKTHVVTFSSDEGSDSGEGDEDADPVSLETETPKVMTPIRRARRARTRGCPDDATPRGTP